MFKLTPSHEAKINRVKLDIIKNVRIMFQPLILKNALWLWAQFFFFFIDFDPVYLFKNKSAMYGFICIYKYKCRSNICQRDSNTIRGHIGTILAQAVFQIRSGAFRCYPNILEFAVINEYILTVLNFYF